MRGELTAEGTADQKIVLTSIDEPGKQENRTVRLVDGPSIDEGIIQVGFQNP